MSTNPTPFVALVDYASGRAALYFYGACVVDGTVIDVYEHLLKDRADLTLQCADMDEFINADDEARDILPGLFA